MCLFMTCHAYNDIKCGIRVANDVIYLSLETDNHNRFNVTLNPMQARVIGEALQMTSGSMLIAAIGAEQCFFGDVTVNFEIVDDDEKITKAAKSQVSDNVVMLTEPNEAA